MIAWVAKTLCCLVDICKLAIIFVTMVITYKVCNHGHVSLVSPTSALQFLQSLSGFAIFATLASGTPWGVQLALFTTGLFPKLRSAMCLSNSAHWTMCVRVGRLKRRIIFLFSKGGWKVLHQLMSVPRLVFGLSTVQVELRRKRMMSPGLTHLHRNCKKNSLQNDVFL